MSLKNKLRKLPIIFSALSYVKYNIYLPLKRGYVKYYINYLLTKKSFEVKLLKAKGFSKAKTFAPMTWKIGKSKDKACRHYYRAVYNGEPCFIKVGKSDSTVKNEARIYAHLSKDSPAFLARPLLIDNDFADNTVMVANRFVEGLHTVSKIASKDEFVRFCHEFDEVLTQLESKGIVHADIHKGNIAYDSQDNLLLMDFGISILKDADPIVNYSARPGTFYKNSADGKTRTYDDAFSFVKMVEKLEVPKEWTDSKEYSAIVQKVGKNEAIVELD